MASGDVLTDCWCQKRKIGDPQGSDHRLLVQVTEESRRKDVTVALEIDTPNGQAIHTMKPTGKSEGREHSFVIHNVSSELILRARGGDDVTSPVRVKIGRATRNPGFNDFRDLSRLYGDGTSAAGRCWTAHGLGQAAEIRGQIQVNKPLSTCQLWSETEKQDLRPTQDDLTYEVQLPGDEKPLSGGLFEFRLVDKSGLASNRANQIGCQYYRRWSSKNSGLHVGYKWSCRPAGPDPGVL